ncbi:MAG: hypothetical protein M0D53_16275 [Flavobacterium sp. JAD_PAG50586_2]|nr:MAG: hypothetical protein M0D53_16275 [Flavobacterium sp. JAD_PAG50586_2]
MKRLTLILAVIGMITFGSCSNDDDVDNDTVAEVFRYYNVNFLPNDYSVVLPFPHALYYESDMVLVYRLSGTFNGESIWKLLPETYYFDDGTLDLRYDADFTRFDAEVRLEGFDLAAVNNNFKLNQTLRVVVIPGVFVGKKAAVDYKDYKAVVKAFHIDESKEIKIQQQ